MTVLGVPLEVDLSSRLINAHIARELLVNFLSTHGQDIERNSASKTGSDQARLDLSTRCRGQSILKERALSMHNQPGSQVHLHDSTYWAQ